MKKLSLVALFIVSIILTAVITSHMLYKNQISAFKVALYETQAMLWFNHLLEFRDIETYLSKGCTDAGLEKTRQSIDEEMHLLADFHKDNGNSSLNKYISDRDPELLAQLETFKSKYGNNKKVPECRR
jgi:hypothetical protein